MWSHPRWEYASTLSATSLVKYRPPVMHHSLFLTSAFVLLASSQSLQQVSGRGVVRVQAEGIVEVFRGGFVLARFGQEPPEHLVGPGEIRFVFHDRPQRFQCPFPVA